MGRYFKIAEHESEALSLSERERPSAFLTRKDLAFERMKWGYEIAGLNRTALCSHLRSVENGLGAKERRVPG